MSLIGVCPAPLLAVSSWTVKAVWLGRLPSVYLLKAEGKTWQSKGGVARWDVEMAQVRRHMWNCCCHLEREWGGQRENLHLLGCLLCCRVPHIWVGSWVFLKPAVDPQLWGRFYPQNVKGSRYLERGSECAELMMRK